MLDYKTLQNSELIPLGVWSLNYTAGHNILGIRWNIQPEEWFKQHLWRFLPDIEKNTGIECSCECSLDYVCNKKMGVKQTVLGNVTETELRTIFRKSTSKLG